MKTLLTLILFSLATVATAADVPLSLTDNSDNETGFRWERSIDDGEFEVIGTTLANVTKFFDIDVPTGVVLNYKAHAYNRHGPSGDTNIVIEDTHTPNAPTEMVKEITITEVTHTETTTTTKYQ